MKAYTLKSNGGIENFVLSDLPIPKINSTEVLIKTKAISINRVDAFVRQNEFALKMFLRPEPDEAIILGWDLAGTVEAVGSRVTTFKPGDAVFGLVNFFGQGKTNADYVAAPAHHLAIKPANITWGEAAAAGLAALTAWQAIGVHGKVGKNSKVLIHAAAGGVGHFAVQIAKHLGAFVIGTGSDLSEDFILKLGADKFIDYAKRNFEEEINDADVILDSLAGDHVLRSANAVRDGGRLISLLPYDDKEGKFAEKVKRKKLYTHRVVVQSDGEQMEDIARLLANGKIRSHVSNTFSFEELPLAHLEIETARTKGKIVITM